MHKHVTQPMYKAKQSWLLDSHMNFWKCLATVLLFEGPQKFYYISQLQGFQL